MRAPDERPRPRGNTWIVLAAMITLAVLAALGLAGSLLTIK
jgi:hypothetical protein